MGDVPLRVTPLTIKDANALVARWHRHHRPTVGALFAIGASRGETLVGAVIVGRPVSRHLQATGAIEVVRLVTDGSRNVCSLLYGAARRAAGALGYRRVVTYILESECGASLRGAGWTFVARSPGGAWGRPSRAREVTAPTCPKLRWEVRT